MKQFLVYFKQKNSSFSILFLYFIQIPRLDFAKISTLTVHIYPWSFFYQDPNHLYYDIKRMKQFLVYFKHKNSSFTIWFLYFIQIPRLDYAKISTLTVHIYPWSFFYQDPNHLYYDIQRMKQFLVYFKQKNSSFSIWFLYFIQIPWLDFAKISTLTVHVCPSSFFYQDPNHLY
jgi:hypothetical protein